MNLTFLVPENFTRRKLQNFKRKHSAALADLTEGKHVIESVTIIASKTKAKHAESPKTSIELFIPSGMFGSNLVDWKVQNNYEAMIEEMKASGEQFRTIDGVTIRISQQLVEH